MKTADFAKRKDLGCFRKPDKSLIFLITLPRFLMPPRALSASFHPQTTAILFAVIAMMHVPSSSLAGETETINLAQREIQRRSILLDQLATQLSEAEELLTKGKTAEALTIYEKTYPEIPATPLSQELKQTAREGWLAATLRRAQELVNQGDAVGATRLLDQIEPNLSLEGKAKLTALRGRMRDADRYPPALTPQHIERVEKVQKLLILAASQHETGMFDKAVETYEDVLRIDPTNTAARRGLEKLERERARYFRSAYDHQRSRMLSGVDQLWENKPLSAADLTAKLAADRPADTMASAARKSGKDSISDKLKQLRVAKIDFTEATLEEVIEYLRVRSRDIDPEGRGVDFVLNLGGEIANKSISLSLLDVPLEEVLRYAADAAGVSYRVEEFAVRLVPITDTNETLISKTYRVPPDFISAAPFDPAAIAPADPFAQQAAGAAATGATPLRRLGAKEFLQSRGVVFPEGTGANYNPVTNMLIVRNTAKNLELVDGLVDQALNTSPKMAVIEVKILEVSSKKLDEMGFDWLLGGFRHSGLALGGGTVGNQQGVNFTDTEFPTNSLLNRTQMGPVTSGLRSTPDLIDNRTIDDVLSGAVNTSTGRSPGVFSLAGVLTDPQFQVVWRGMAQKTGVDLMSRPSVITKSGQQATVEVVREFIYPTEFDPPQIPTNVGGGNNNGGGGGGGTTIVSIPVTPTTPTAFETRNVGVRLNVEPVISDDGRSVDLTLTPEYTEFDGFVNYGSPIYSVSPNVPILDIFGNLLGTIPSSRLELTPNIISQPIFSTKKITTSVKIYDGATVVLGGLVSDQSIMMDDKVPVIGSMPYVGKLFQSKVEQKRTKNLVMFVSVKVVDPSGSRVNRP